MKTERNKLMCDYWNKGLTITEISKLIGVAKNNIVKSLRLWYPVYYNQEYIGKNSLEGKEKYFKDLYEKYKEIYSPFIYKQKELLNLLGCNANQFDLMCKKYNIHHQRANVYKYQRTLCNVPDVYYQMISKVANKRGQSVRELVTNAISVYLLDCKELEGK